jgi:hypothetical protein
VKKSFSNSNRPVDDRRVTSNKPREGRSKVAQIKQKHENLAESNLSSSEEELITKYDTKEFKGGSMNMKDRVLNSYYNIQR